MIGSVALFLGDWFHSYGGSFMKLFKTGLIVGASILVPATAFAQAQPAATPPAGGSAAPASSASAPASAAPAAGASTAIAAGAKVVDPQGAPVGSIESVNGDTVVLATSKSKVSISKSSFAVGPNGPMIGMTAAQVDAAAAPAQAAQAQAAAAKPNVAAGAAVADMQGQPVGKIASVDGQLATLQLTTGTKVRLPVTAFGAGDNGGLKIAMTAQQLSSAGAAAPAAAGSSSGGK
jgi:hypothetical protein